MSDLFRCKYDSIELFRVSSRVRWLKGVEKKVFRENKYFSERRFEHLTR